MIKTAAKYSDLYWAFIRFEEKRIVAQEHRQGAITRLLTLAAAPGEGTRAGRGRVRYFRFGDSEAVVRRCMRGGLIRHFLRASYLLRNRPLAEFRVHAAAFERGLPVVEPLGVSWTRHGLLFRGMIATTVFHGMEFGEQMRAAGPDENVLREVGKAIRALHDGGVVHPDLQIANILVRGTEVRFVDLDNASLRSNVGRVPRSKNLLRLRHSMRKHGFPSESFDAIHRAYGEIRFPHWLRAWYAIRGMIAGTKAAPSPAENAQTA